MIRRLALAALLALAPSLASAQFAAIAPTPATSDNGDRIATTAWVNNFVNAGLPLANGKIWIGSAGGIATAVTPSGDGTFSNAGVLTITQAAGNFNVIGNLGVTGTSAFTGGVTLGSPTGGNKGAGTSNSANDYYKNGTIIAETASAPLVLTAGNLACPSCVLISGTAHGDSAYAILSTDRYVYTSAAFTAARIWTLPAANSLPVGTTIWVQDAQGTVTTTNTLTIQRAGADTIDVSNTSLVITGAGGGITFTTDGVSNWGTPIQTASTGGTGQKTLTNHGVLVGAGTSPITQLAVAATGTVLRGATGADPAFGAVNMATDMTGTMLAAQEPAHTGSVINTAGSLAMALNATINPEGRLTLTTGTPVLTSTVSGATSVIYALYAGNLVPIYDGTNMVPTAITELSNVNANSSVGSAGPAAVATSSCYDYFVWSNTGTPTLTRGPAWTSTTARSAGTALARTNGIWLNSVTITNGPAASRGTYVGTACSNGTATFDWILGASASGGTAASFGIWNNYNRVSVSTTVFDTGTSYTYLAATIRQARASAGNQIGFVAGLVEDGFPVTMVGQVNTAATAGATAMWGIGLNSTSTFAAGRTFGQAATAVTTVFGSSASANLIPQLGLNVISANEASDGATTNTFDFNGLNNLSATLRM